MQEIEFSQWPFELPAKWHSQFSPSGSRFLPCLGLPSKSHRENSIFSIFLESPHQVGMKNVVKCYKHFFGYFNALKTHGVNPRLRYGALVPAECIYENLSELVVMCFLCLSKTSAGPAMAQFTICAVKRMQVWRDIFACG